MSHFVILSSLVALFDLGRLPLLYSTLSESGRVSVFAHHCTSCISPCVWHMVGAQQHLMNGGTRATVGLSLLAGALLSMTAPPLTSRENVDDLPDV